MNAPAFSEALRRVITGEAEHGRSLVVVEGPPAGKLAAPGMGGLFEIWHETLADAMDPRDGRDRGEATPVLSPDAGCVKVRWFAIEPPPEGAPAEALKAAARARFEQFGAADHLRDQDRHPAMHQTDTIDIICLLAGEASLILDDSETRLKPGDVVIQRGVSHAWTAHGGRALFLAVLIDRRMK